MRYILARYFYNKIRQLFVLPGKVSNFEDAMPSLITVLRRPISS